MSFTHVFSQSVQTPEGVLTDSGTEKTGDTSSAVSTSVAANGGGANTVSLAITAAGLQSVALLSTVPCVVSFTGTTAVNGVSGSPGSITLAANVMGWVYSITTNCTGLSIGANTDVSGAAGTIEVRALYNT